MNIEELEQKLKKDWQELNVTSEQRHEFTILLRHLAINAGSSTYMVGRQLSLPCGYVRKLMRRMERLGYVAGKSNGSNNIYWKLA